MRILTFARLLVLPAIAVAFFATASSAYATDFQVCKGCPLGTIEAATDIATDGDTIIVGPGNYPENVVVNSTLVIRGAQAGTSGVGRADTGATVIVGSVQVFDEATLDGLVINGVAGYAVEASAPLLLRDSVVRGGTGELLNGGVTALDVAALTVSRSTITISVSGDAVKAANVDSLTVADSVLAYSNMPAVATVNGVAVSGANSFQITGNVFRDFDNALKVTGTLAGAPAFRRNRIDRQTASSHGLDSPSTAGSIDATDNFWGCGSAIPKTSGTCDVLNGTGVKTVVPYGVLVTTPSASPIPAMTPITLTASVRRQDGSALPGGLPLGDGANVTFTASSGALAAAVVAASADGASTTWTPTPTGGPVTFRSAIDGAEFTSVTAEARAVTPTASKAALYVGAPRFASTLTCTRAIWSVAGTATYAWLRNGVIIPGAVSAKYTPVLADIGKRLSCRDTNQVAFADAAASTSAARLVSKRRITLALFQTSFRGVVMRCGTARKPCVHKLPAALYMKVGEHASHFKGLKVKVVLERKMGRRWVVAKTQVATVTLKPFAVSTRLLAKGSYRARVTFGPSRTDLLAASAYRYLTIR